MCSVKLGVVRMYGGRMRSVSDVSLGVMGFRVDAELRVYGI